MSKDQVIGIVNAIHEYIMKQNRAECDYEEGDEIIKSRHTEWNQKESRYYINVDTNARNISIIIESE